MNLIAIEEIKKAQINFNLACEKKLIQKDNYALYQWVYELYQKGLDTFLLKNTHIQEYDMRIKNSNLDFGIMPLEKRHPFHKKSYLNLDYLYVRNFLYIEKLSINDLTVLIDKVVKQDFNVDDTLLSIVEKSYKEIIVNNYRDGVYKENAKACYGNVIPSNIVPSNHLVFNLQYGKNSKTYSREEFYANQQAKDQFLTELVETMKKELEAKLNVEVTVLVRTFIGE